MTHRIKMIMLGAVLGCIGNCWAKEFYYIKNDTGVRLDVEIACGNITDTMSIDQGATARFFITKCTQKPTFSVVAIGTKDSLAKVKGVSLPKRYVRISRDIKL